MRRRGFILEFGNQEVTPPRQLAQPVTFPGSAPQTQGSVPCMSGAELPAWACQQCQASEVDAPHPLVPFPRRQTQIGERTWQSCGSHMVALPGPKLRAIRCKCTHMRPQEKQIGARLKAGPGQPHPLIGPGAGARLGDLPPAVLALRSEIVSKPVDEFGGHNANILFLFIFSFLFFLSSRGGCLAWP